MQTFSVFRKGQKGISDHINGTEQGKLGVQACAFVQGFVPGLAVAFHVADDYCAYNFENVSLATRQDRWFSAIIAMEQ